MFESLDGGSSWTFSSRGLAALFIQSLAVDPSDPCRIYAGTTNRGLLAFTKSGTPECN